MRNVRKRDQGGNDKEIFDRTYDAFRQSSDFDNISVDLLVISEAFGMHTLLIALMWCWIQRIDEKIFFHPSRETMEITKKFSFIVSLTFCYVQRREIRRVFANFMRFDSGER